MNKITNYKLLMQNLPGIQVWSLAFPNKDIDFDDLCGCENDAIILSEGYNIGIQSGRYITDDELRLFIKHINPNIKFPKKYKKKGISRKQKLISKQKQEIQSLQKSLRAIAKVLHRYLREKNVKKN